MDGQMAKRSLREQMWSQSSGWGSVRGGEQQLKCLTIRQLHVVKSKTQLALAYNQKENSRNRALVMAEFICMYYIYKYYIHTYIVKQQLRPLIDYFINCNLIYLLNGLYLACLISTFLFTDLRLFCDKFIYSIDQIYIHIY